jgi:DUF971 family protein
MNPSPSAAASEPKHIAISKSAGIKLEWKDGHHSEFSLELLRDECPCAACTGAHGTEPQRTSHSQANPFQMYKARLKMDSVEAVGSYAIRIFWNDGHNTGIYSFDHLRKICPCSGCKQARTGAA